MDTATVARFSIILRLRPLLLLLRTHQVCACVKLRMCFVCMRFVCMRFVCVCVVCACVCVCVCGVAYSPCTRSLFRHSRILPVIDCWRAVVLVMLPLARCFRVAVCALRNRVSGRGSSFCCSHTHRGVMSPWVKSLRTVFCTEDHEIIAAQQQQPTNQPTHTTTGLFVTHTKRPPTCHIIHAHAGTAAAGC